MDDALETLESRDGRSVVLAEGVDERGEWVRFRHTNRRVGVMAGPHWHPELAERFTVVAGTLHFRLDGLWCDLGPGESVVVGPGQVHEFRWAGGGDELVFEHEVRPPGQHRAMFRTMHALENAGRLTRSGLPRNPLALGLLWSLQDGYVVGPPPWLQTLLLGGLGRLARAVGYDRRLGAG